MNTQRVNTHALPMCSTPHTMQPQHQNAPCSAPRPLPPSGQMSQVICCVALLCVMPPRLGPDHVTAPLPPLACPHRSYDDAVRADVWS